VIPSEKDYPTLLVRCNADNDALQDTYVIPKIATAVQNQEK